MDGMLSQDEINALLSGMDLADGGDSTAGGAGETQSSGAFDSEEFSSDSSYDAAPVSEGVGEESLTDVDKDAIGEVANISMGSSATTLYSLVNRKVNITTPVVRLATWDTLLDEYERPCVFIQIKYTQGLDGTNILVLKENDVKVITDLMMGGDGTNTDVELGELHLSAISEAMNQMMGSAATSLSTMLGTIIDISPPDSTLLNLTEYKSGSEISPFLGGTFVKISFRMQIDDLVDSTIMQLYPIDFAKKLVDTFISTQMGGSQEQPAPAQTPPPVAPSPVAAMGGADFGGQMPINGQPAMGGGQEQAAAQPQYGNPAAMGAMPPYGMQDPYGNPYGGQVPMQGQMPMGMAPQVPMGNQMPYGGQMPYGNQIPFGQAPMGGQMPVGMQNINIQPAQFQNFSSGLGSVTSQENIGLIMDVPLEVTVELGRTTKSISDILEFAPGTIIELDRIAGEPIDVLVNGKFVARGEVVVIEESFGIRVTEIIK